MEVAAFLPPQLLSHLRVVLGRDHSLISVDGWQPLVAALRRVNVDVVVVDPQVQGVLHAPEVQRLIDGFPRTPIVIYTLLSPGSLRAVVQLARAGLQHVVLHRFDDEPHRFRELLERLPGEALGQTLLERLSIPLARLPANTERAIERLFAVPSRFTSSPDLAAASGVTVRQLYRQLEVAGLASPRIVIQGARVLRAYAYLQNPGCLVEDVARKLGYSAPRVLSAQIREMTGTRASEWCCEMQPAQLIELLARRLWRGSD